MSKVRKIVKWIGRFLSVISIIFIVYAIWKLGFDFSAIHNWPRFLLISFVCVVIKGVTVFVSGLAWVSWLKFFSRIEVNRREALFVYAKANIGKYLPGNVMHYVERNLFATNLGISQKKLAVSTVCEVCSLVLSALVISLCAAHQQLILAFQKIFGDSYQKVMLLAVIVVIAVLLIVVFVLYKKRRSLLLEYARKELVFTLLKAMLQYAIVLVALGLVMVILYLYMGGQVDLQTGASIVAGYIVAWVLGFIIPGASGGIGIREMVITLLLGSIVGGEMVLTLSVIHRLITIVGDFLAYVARFLLRRKSK